MVFSYRKLSGVSTPLASHQNPNLKGPMRMSAVEENQVMFGEVRRRPRKGPRAGREDEAVKMGHLG